MGANMCGEMYVLSAWLCATFSASSASAALDGRRGRQK